MSTSKGHSLKEIQHDRTFLTSVIITTLLSCTVIVLLVLITVLYLLKKRRKKNVAAPKRELVLPSHNHLDSTKVEMPQRVSDDVAEKLLAEHSRKISIPQQVFAASVPFNFPASSKTHEKVLGSRLSRNAFRSSFNKLTPGVSNTNLLYQKGSPDIERRSGEIQYNFSRSMSVPTVKEAIFFNEDGEKMWLSSLSMMGASPELIQKKAWNGAHGKVKFAMYYNRRGENELQVKVP